MHVIFWSQLIEFSLSYCRLMIFIQVTQVEFCNKEQLLGKELLGSYLSSFVIVLVVTQIMQFFWDRVVNFCCLTHSLIRHFETIPISKKLQTTTEIGLLKDFKMRIAQIVEKGEIAHFQQFHLFPQFFPQSFFLQSVKMSINGGKG